MKIIELTEINISSNQQIFFFNCLTSSMQYFSFISGREQVQHYLKTIEMSEGMGQPGQRFDNH